ncbi:STAS domain-containing protein [Azotosporobacter soli]|uniref:STAS domain-containing protein n=1 Tax=Azotosporobacter soli TaxID=3055040 RepID=UPI0031FF1500
MNEHIMLPPDFSGRNATQARNAFLQLVAPGVKKIIADGSRVDAVDAVGLGVLVMTQRRLQKQGGELVLQGMSQPMAVILDKVRLRSSFGVPL